MKKNVFKTAVILCTICALAFFGVLFYQLPVKKLPPSQPVKTHMFAVQSIDTMKESRDNAREALSNLPEYKKVIDANMALVEAAGATHVAIDTPYDPEFLPVLQAWVNSARAHHLSVWFRGNFSGWEGWFNYPKMSRSDHLHALQQFIKNNPGLFEDGDIFTPCPECENGGPGDPRQTGDAAGFNSFMLQEKQATDTAFDNEQKKVTVYDSMNADIAKTVLTPKTIDGLGGVVLIDHYVKTVAQFKNDIQNIPKEIGGVIGLGEFGAPVPDLQGDMTNDAQAQYVGELLQALNQNNKSIPLVNYWDLTGGSTALAQDDGTPKEAYAVVQSYYTAPRVYGSVYNTLGDLLASTVSVPAVGYDGNFPNGSYEVFLPTGARTLQASAPGYNPVTVTLSKTVASSTVKDFYLMPMHESLWYKLRLFLQGQSAHS